MPTVRRRDTALDGARRPAAVIATTEVAMRRCRDAPEAFALAEGAGEFGARRAGRARSLARAGGFDSDTALVRERFRRAAIPPRRRFAAALAGKPAPAALSHRAWAI